MEANSNGDFLAEPGGALDQFRLVRIQTYNWGTIGASRGRITHQRRGLASAFWDQSHILDCTCQHLTPRKDRLEIVGRRRCAAMVPQLYVWIRTRRIGLTRLPAQRGNPIGIRFHHESSSSSVPAKLFVIGVRLDAVPASVRVDTS